MESDPVLRAQKLKDIEAKKHLFINRLPGDSKDRFISFADAEYDGDYGMALKFLLDFREGVIFNGYEELSSRMDRIEQSLASKEEPVRKTLSGRVLRVNA